MKAQYLILGIGEGCDETATEVTRYVFNRIKTSLYNKTVDSYSSTTEYNAYYEIKTYFDCNNEKGHRLYILIERRAKDNYSFVD